VRTNWRPSTKASLVLYALAIAATVAASSSAAAARHSVRESVPAASRSAKQLPTTVVPLRIQRLLKRRAPIAAYVPTRVPRGFRYYHYENLGRSGFDLYFQCCGRVRPIGFDALHVWPGEPCNQGTAMKVFRIDGVRVAWNSGHNDEQAWRCISLRDGTHVLLTVSTGSDWRTPNELARMVASARRIR